MEQIDLICLQSKITVIYSIHYSSFAYMSVMDGAIREHERRRKEDGNA